LEDQERDGMLVLSDVTGSGRGPLESTVLVFAWPDWEQTTNFLRRRYLPACWDSNPSPLDREHCIESFL